MLDFAHSCHLYPWNGGPAAPVDSDQRANAREMGAGDPLQGEVSPATLRRVAEGDLAALATVYNAYAERVYRLAYRLTRSVQDAQDVVQDVFLGLREALAPYRGQGPFDAWLRTAAVRVALHRLRQRERRREVAMEPDWLVGPPPPHGARIDLEAALARLPETLRVVVVLKEVEGFSHDEIGDILGISAAASATRLMRARAKLRRTLG